MAKYTPNQKYVTVHKEKIIPENKYICTDMEALDLAAQKLKAGAFKLWIYLSKNKDSYYFGLSPRDTAASFGIKDDQYDTAVKSLIKEGYLVQKEEGKEYYDFYELPHVEGKSIHVDVVGKNPDEMVGGKNPYESDVGVKPTYVVVGKNPYAQGENPSRNNINNIIDNIEELPPITLMQLSQLTAPYTWVIEEKVVKLCNGKEFKVV